MKGEKTMATTKFDFSGATYARAGNVNKFVTEFKSKIKEMTTKLDTNGSTYKEVLAEIDANWSGADADKFKKQFKDAVSRIQKKYKEYDKLIDTAFKDDTKSFLNMQQGNAGLFGGK